MSDNLKASFFGLSADRILTAVEEALGERATGRIVALNSLENRVHEIELENGQYVVSKFYRPHRWNENQLSEEHLFLEKLRATEVPVVCPLPLKGKLVRRTPTLAQLNDGIFFTIFPKVRGKLIDEFTDLHLQTLGRYLGRIHQVGKAWVAKHRMKMNVTDWGWKPLDELADSEFFEPNVRVLYETVAEKFLEIAEERLHNVRMSSVHGDCHLGNTLWHGDAPFFLDFDDMMVAPPVQDLWMVIRGRDEEAQRQRQVFLQSYEQFCEFEYETLGLIEVLRGLRIIFYSAWIAKRFDDPSFPQAFPNFATSAYWRSEIEALEECAQLSQSVDINY